MQHEDLSIISLILNASIVVQLILALLVSLSIGSWSIIIRKGFALGSVKRATEEFEKNFWSGGDLNTLLEAAQRNQKQYANSLERIFQSGMQEFLKARDIDPARRAMKATYQREMDSLESNLPFLASVGSVSPYIGLFGTVWGIMNSFRGLANVQQATLASVAPGIAEALVATVETNKQLFSQREVKDADKAIELIKALGYPSQRTVVAIPQPSKSKGLVNYG
jgi:biopolymer transport protein TolQ